MTNFTNSITTSMNKKNIFLGFLVSILFLTTIVSTVVAGVASKRKSEDADTNIMIEQHQAGHAVLKSSCSATLYPEHCISAIISNVPEAASKIKTSKDVIHALLNVTISAVQNNYASIKKLSGSRSFTQREKVAFNDCLELVDETLVELNKVLNDLSQYPSLNKSISEHADDLKTLLSAAMTNQESCLDGFSHDKADKKVRELFIASQMNVYRMCSNSLAMIKNMTDTDMAKLQYSNQRKLQEEKKRLASPGSEWPEWLSAGDRKLLQARTVTPNVVVAADGTGDYRTVAAAVEAAPERSSTRYIIKIKAGVYRENVEVSSRKTNIMFVGDGRSNTTITGYRNVVDGSTTFNSATVAVVGERFLARDITFENTAGPSKHQAVALRVGSDLSAFYKCDMLAYQDTLYVHSLRQFFIDCYIAGTVDFIFGNGAALLQNCDIHARRPNPGQRNMVTAQGRTDPNQNTGIVIQNCSIGATQDLLETLSSFPTYLGRPWKEYSRTIIMQSVISNVIQPQGWFEWNGNFALDTLDYGEYQNSGPGADVSNRVTWKGFRVITEAADVQMFTAENFIAGAAWLDSTGFPYSPGL